MFAIDVPMPIPEQDTSDIVRYLQNMMRISDSGVVRGGVIAEGEAAAYALVWEYGNARQTKKGPKTTLGTNPDGEQVWLSIQAPEGYIWINEGTYVQIILKMLEEVNFSDLDSPEEIYKAMLDASARAAAVIAKMISEAAPVDKGTLRDSIKPADPRDPDLASDDEDDIELGDGSGGVEDAG